MNVVIKLFGELGVDESDIKTTQYNLQPRYEYLKEVNPERIEVDEIEYIRPNDNGKRVIVGYTLNQSVGVKIRDLEKIGEIIKETTEVGVNQSGGINFTIDDTDVLKAEARDEAIRKAKEKAVDIASVSGLELGKLVNVSEGGSYIPTYKNNYAYAESYAMDSMRG